MSAPKSINVVIVAACQAEITLETHALAGGHWKVPPVPGTIISPTNTTDYMNVAESGDDFIGGSISLSPASGGLITVNWSWPSGSLPTSSVTTSGLKNLAASYFMNGTQTSSPTLQLIVTNAALFS